MASYGLTYDQFQELFDAVEAESPYSMALCFGIVSDEDEDEED